MEEVETPKSNQTKEGEVWNYDFFREYLRAVSSRGLDFVLPIEDYPQRIALSDKWHQNFDRIRKESQDGLERFAILGFKVKKNDPTKVDIKLQTRPAIGLPDRVPPELILSEIRRAQEAKVIDDVFGDVHSHPRKLHQEIFGGLIKRKESHFALFSAVDLYRMIIPEKSFLTTTVVEGNNQLFVFRTRQTVSLGIDRNLFNQDSFEKFWRDKQLDPWEMNQAIGARHRLVFYRGDPGKDLVRVFPPRWLLESWQARKN